MAKYNSKADISAFCRRHKEVIDALTDVLTEHKVSPAEGEEVMLWLVGLSRGMRAVSATDNIEIMAHGWNMGASHG